MRDINDRLYDINDKKWPTIEVLILSPIAIMHVDAKYNVLVWCGSFSHCNFLNSPIICQQTHMCAKIVKSLDKKVWGGVKR